MWFPTAAAGSAAAPSLAGNLRGPWPEALGRGSSPWVRLLGWRGRVLQPSDLDRPQGVLRLSDQSLEGSAGLSAKAESRDSVWEVAKTLSTGPFSLSLAPVPLTSGRS